MDWKIVLFVLCAVIGGTAGQNMRCYSCGFSSTDSDRSCLTITESTTTVVCPHAYCTILRQEFVDPSGVVASFTRGCESAPAFLNHEVTDSTFRTFYRACTSNLCNIGNGVQSIAGGALSPNPQYDGENLLVPGTGSDTDGASHKNLSITLMVLCIITIFMQ